MRAQIEEYDARVARRYVASKRHTIQVDFHKYLAEITQERRDARARVSGRPVTPAARLREGLRRLPRRPVVNAAGNRADPS